MGGKLTHLFDNKKRMKEAGRQALHRWLTEVKNSGLGCFDKIKVLKRRCYGLRNLPKLFRRLWLDLRGYEAFAQRKQQNVGGLHGDSYSCLHLRAICL